MGRLQRKTSLKKYREMRNEMNERKVKIFEK